MPWKRGPRPSRRAAACGRHGNAEPHPVAIGKERHFRRSAPRRGEGRHPPQWYRPRRGGAPPLPSQWERGGAGRRRFSTNGNAAPRRPAPVRAPRARAQAVGRHRGAGRGWAAISAAAPGIRRHPRPPPPPAPPAFFLGPSGARPAPSGGFGARRALGGRDGGSNLSHPPMSPRPLAVSGPPPSWACAAYCGLARPAARGGVRRGPENPCAAPRGRGRGSKPSPPSPPGSCRSRCPPALTGPFYSHGVGIGTLLSPPPHIHSVSSYRFRPPHNRLSAPLSPPTSSTFLSFPPRTTPLYFRCSAASFSICVPMPPLGCPPPPL